MNAFDKLADDLGQIIFRVETNLHTARKKVAVEDMPPYTSVQVDIEKLKELKERILALPEYGVRVQLFVEDGGNTGADLGMHHMPSVPPQGAQVTLTGGKTCTVSARPPWYLRTPHGFEVVVYVNLVKENKT